MEKNYNSFICYRGKEGEEIASSIYFDLCDNKLLSPFFAPECLADSEKVDSTCINIAGNVLNMILVLTLGFFEGCTKKDDLVLRELKASLKNVETSYIFVLAKGVEYDQSVLDYIFGNGESKLFAHAKIVRYLDKKSFSVSRDLLPLLKKDLDDMGYIYCIRDYKNLSKGEPCSHSSYLPPIVSDSKIRYSLKPISSGDVKENKDSRNTKDYVSVSRTPTPIVQERSTGVRAKLVGSNSADHASVLKKSNFRERKKENTNTILSGLRGVNLSKRAGFRAMSETKGKTILSKLTGSTKTKLAGVSLSTTEKKPLSEKNVDRKSKMDSVQFTALAPNQIVPGEMFDVKVLMYEDEYKEIVVERIAQYKHGVKQDNSGYVDVWHDASIKVHLYSENEDIKIHQSILEYKWNGKKLEFGFVAKTPKGFNEEQILLCANVYVDNLIVTRLQLILNCTKENQNRVKVDRHDVNSAFISYAHKDLKTVISIIQGIKTRSNIDIFFDQDSLRSGDNWPEKLMEEIKARDVLFLCWSKHAKKSEWVEKEWRYALKHKGINAIEPIPLVRPNKCPPPKELNSIHFGDKMLNFLNKR